MLITRERKHIGHRRCIAECLLLQLTQDDAILIDIDHGFSMPLRYFERYHLLPD